MLCYGMSHEDDELKPPYIAPRTNSTKKIKFSCSSTDCGSLNIWSASPTKTATERRVEYRGEYEVADRSQQGSQPEHLDR